MTPPEFYKMDIKSNQLGNKRPISLTSILVPCLRIIIALCILLIVGCINSFIFFPQPIAKETLNVIKWRYKHAEEITIKTSDNVGLKGWFVKQSSMPKSPLILYFGGNAEEVSYLIKETPRITGWSLALINYRGYGLSEGTPNEGNLCKDAVEIYDYFSKRPEIDNSKIVAFGRSLGTGVAVYLAQQRPIKGVILATPYDSINSVAQEKVSFIPVWLIFRNRFNSLSRAPSVNIPMLALLASEDKVIPTWHAKRLIEKWAGKNTVITIEGAGHNTITYSELYWESINDFLTQF